MNNKTFRDEVVSFLKTLYIKKTFQVFCYRGHTKGKQPISFNLIKFVTTEIFPAFNNYETVS